jgi:hypothetical protein
MTAATKAPRKTRKPKAATVSPLDLMAGMLEIAERNAERARLAALGKAKADLEMARHAVAKAIRDYNDPTVEPGMELRWMVMGDRIEAAEAEVARLEGIVANLGS